MSSRPPEPLQARRVDIGVQAVLEVPPVVGQSCPKPGVGAVPGVAAPLCLGSRVQGTADRTWPTSYGVEALSGPPGTVGEPPEAADLVRPTGRAEAARCSTWETRRRTRSRSNRCHGQSFPCRSKPFGELVEETVSELLPQIPTGSRLPQGRQGLPNFDTRRKVPTAQFLLPSGQIRGGSREQPGDYWPTRTWSRDARCGRQGPTSPIGPLRIVANTSLGKPWKIPRRPK